MAVFHINLSAEMFQKIVIIGGKYAEDVGVSHCKHVQVECQGTKMKNRAVMEVEISQHETIPGKRLGARGVLERYHIEHASGLLKLLIDRKCNFHKDKQFTRGDYIQEIPIMFEPKYKGRMSQQERAKGITQKRKRRK